MLQTMLRIRRFEERCVALSSKGKLPGFLHLYIGEEAVATGVCANLQADDYITSTHRGHGHVIAKGGDVRRMMAELYGKETGYCKGKGGSMHIADGRIGILGANGIVGGGLQIAAGAGTGLQFLGKDQVVVCFFGDGAASQGAFHESVNLSSTWKLPVIYVNENNGFAISTDGSRQRNIEQIAGRAVAYGIPGRRIDGNDVMQVYETANEAVRRARAGEGPTLIECVTWRWRGHSEGDPEHYYRTQAETEAWMEKDPILALEKRIIEAQYADQAVFEAINEAVMKEIDEAVDFGEQSAYPDIKEVISDVYAEATKGNRENA